MSSSAALCPRCLFRTGPLLPAVRPWRAKQGMASAMRRRRTPSRMTLSQDVARSGGEKRLERKDVAGPFGGMNQTVMRTPLRRRSTPTRSPVDPDTRRAVGETQRTQRSPRNGERADERPTYHALKMQQILAPLSYNQRDKLKAKLATVQSFDELGLMPSVSNAVYTQVLSHLKEHMPTPVQKLAIPALLSRRDEHKKQAIARDGKPSYDQFLLAAETGSGKTLAYLLPLIHRLKEQEALDAVEQALHQDDEQRAREERRDTLVFDADPSETDEPMHASTGRPRILILLPSAELVAQVTKVVKLIGHSVKYKSTGISAQNSATVIRNRLFNPNGIDVVVASPHLIASIAEKEPNILAQVQYMVVDEADSLFDRSFSRTTCELIDRATPSLKQLILCSATIPNSLDRFIDRRFPDCKRIVTPKLHTIPRRVQLGAVDIDKDPYRGSRDLACADVIWTLGKSIHDDTSGHNSVKHILVFVNERDNAETLAKFLAGKGIDAVAMTRDTTAQRQAEILSSFTSVDRVAGSAKPPAKNFRSFIPFEGVDPAQADAGPMRYLPDTKVLVTTDLASRGVDTLAVRHVILYDVPHTTVDFVHRLGRMGRINRRGRGIVLMGRHDRKDVIREVREAMHKGQALI